MSKDKKFQAPDLSQYDEIGRLIPTKKEEVDSKEQQIMDFLLKLPETISFIGKDGIQRTSSKKQLQYLANELFRIVHEGQAIAPEELDNFPPHFATLLEEVLRKRSEEHKRY